MSEESKDQEPERPAKFPVWLPDPTSMLAVDLDGEAPRYRGFNQPWTRVLLPLELQPQIQFAVPFPVPGPAEVVTEIPALAPRPGRDGYM